MLELVDGVAVKKIDKRLPRRADFLADVGRSLAPDAKTRTEAVRSLRQAEEAAPQRVRNSAAVQGDVSPHLGATRIR